MKKEQKLHKNIKSTYNLFFKRLIDITISTLLIIFLFPFIIFISLIQVIFSGFPILYKPYRGGFKGKKFRILKFRTMIKNADTIGGGTTALNDKRITKFGKFLRKTKIDEIPQLFNVIKGEMSFVGPRPELLEYVKKYDNLEKYILEVRPGITDFSSLEYINLDEIVGSENPDLEYETKVLCNKNRLRMKYIENISFKTDLYIFLKTIFGVLKKIINYLYRGLNGKSKIKK